MEYLALFLILGFVVRMVCKREAGIKLIVPCVIIVVSSIFLFEDIKIAIALSVVILVIAYLGRMLLSDLRVVSAS